jgi:hypothetical protein
LCLLMLSPVCDVRRFESRALRGSCANDMPSHRPQSSLDAHAAIRGQGGAGDSRRRAIDHDADNLHQQGPVVTGLTVPFEAGDGTSRNSDGPVGMVRLVMPRFRVSDRTPDRR